MAFDAGAIIAHLDVETKLADDRLRAFEARVKRFENEPHHVRIDARFEDSSTSRARQMFASLDNMISRDAANRLRNSPQGSILGALNALFSPHPVTGSPTVQQAASQGMLGRLISAPGATQQTRAQERLPPAAPGAPQEAARQQVVTQQDNRRGFLAGLLAGRAGGGGDGYGVLPWWRSGGGGGGGGGFFGGLARGIGPGIGGVGARPLTIAGLLGPALGALPGLLGPLGALGAAGGGALALRALSSGALQQVTPLVQLSQQIQNAQLTATTPLQKQQLAAQQASLKNALSQIAPWQRTAFQALNGLNNWWQNLTQSFGPGLAKVLAIGAHALRGLAPDIKSVFGAAMTLARPFIRGLTDIARMVLPLLAAGFRAAAPAVRPLLDGLGKLVAGILPGLNTLIRASLPAVKVFAQILAMLGNDLGKMFSVMAPAVRQSSVIFRALMGVLGAILPIIGNLAAIFAKTLAPVFVQFATAIRALLPFLTTIGHVFASLASAVLKDLALALGALARLLVRLAPSFNILAGVLSKMFSVLENSGVFAILGTTLEKLVPVLATFVNTLVRQLAPDFPIIISLVSQLASILAVLLANGLGVVLKAVTELVTWLGPLIKWLGLAAIADYAFGVALEFVAANPVVLIIAGIVALIGAIVLLVTHWKQVWGAIKQWAADAWNFIYHGFGKFLLPLLGPAGLIALGAIELYQHWKTIWAGIKQVAADLWHWLWADFGQKIYNFFVKTIPGWFNTAVTAIGNAWNAIQNAIKTPVNWVIQFVLNDGIIKAFDWISSKVGGPSISPIPLIGAGPAAAEGGGGNLKAAQHGWRVPGFGGGDRHPALLEGGETVVDKWRSRLLAPLFKMLGVPGYQGGGVVGSIVGAITGAAGLPGGQALTDILALLGIGGGAGIAQVFARMVPAGTGGAVGDLSAVLHDTSHILTTAAVAYLVKAASSMAQKAGAGRGHFGRGSVPANAVAALALRMAIARGWGNLWGAIQFVENAEAGWNLHAQNPTSRAYGIAQFINGPSEYYQWGGNPFTAAGQITAFYNYMRSRYGGPAGAAQHEARFHWYDTGGWMYPGPMSGTGREAVLTPGQSGAFMQMAGALAAMSAGGGDATLSDVVDRLDRVLTALSAAPGRTGTVLGAVLNGTARGARQASRGY